MTEDMMTAALAYAQRAPVFPCAEGAKRPIPAGGFHAATQDEDQIRRWWSLTPNANIALAIPTDLVVLDVDPRNGGDVPPGLPSTRTAMTAGGGVHLYFRVPAGRAHEATRAQLVRGVDVKRGGKGYVLLPPSSIVGAGAYVWEGDGTEAIAELPVEVWDQLVKPADILYVAVERPAGFVHDAGANTTLLCQLGELALADNGTRNETLNRVAFKLARLVVAGRLLEDDTLEKIATVAERIGLESTEILDVLRRAFDDAKVKA